MSLVILHIISVTTATTPNPLEIHWWIYHYLLVILTLSILYIYNVTTLGHSQLLIVTPNTNVGKMQINI
jgi:hypothetical protein